MQELLAKVIAGRWVLTTEGVTLSYPPGRADTIVPLEGARWTPSQKICL
jgi:hypothetical protein